MVMCPFWHILRPVTEAEPPVLLPILVFTLLSINAADSKKYGNEITLSEKTEISQIMANPENFVGKKVLVEGTIVDD